MTRKRKVVDKVILAERSEEFQLQLKNRFEALPQEQDIDERCSNLTTVIKDEAEKIASSRRPKPKRRKVVKGNQRSYEKT